MLGDNWAFVKRSVWEPGFNLSLSVPDAVRPNQPKRWSLMHRRFIAGLSKENEAAYAQENLTPQRLSGKSLFKAEVGEGSHRLCDELVHDCDWLMVR